LAAQLDSRDASFLKVAKNAKTTTCEAITAQPKMTHAKQAA
jgi:hypothetical protein